MKTIEQSLADIDDFLAHEAEAFAVSAKKAAAAGIPNYVYYAEGVSCAYRMVRAMIHTNVLGSRVEPGDVLTSAIITRMRRTLPAALERDILDNLEPGTDVTG